MALLPSPAHGTLIPIKSHMARSLFQKPPVRPVDLFENFIEQRGELRIRRTNLEFPEARRLSGQKFPLIMTVLVWLMCAAFCVSVVFLAWLIVGALTMYRL